MTLKALGRIDMRHPMGGRYIGISKGAVACKRIRNNSFGAYHRMFSCARTSSRFNRRRRVGGGRHGHASYMHGRDVHARADHDGG